jgi:hypothetical protein
LIRRRALRRLAVGALLLAATTAPPAPSATPMASPVPPHEYVQAVEFPYYLYPRALWERELVWMKTVGIRTVAFSVPWNWHQLAPGDYDFTGRTSPRRDLVAFIRLLRRLNLLAWVRPLPPVAAWRDQGTPAVSDAAARRAWLKQLEQLLATQTASHGGPVAYVEGRALAIDAEAPPAQLKIISANDPQALIASRVALTASGGSGALLWTDVEDALYPVGWEPAGTPFLRKGAVGLSGDERPAISAFRCDAALLHSWAPLMAALQPAVVPKPASGNLPAGVSVDELVSPVASVASISNRSSVPFHDDLRVLDPVTRRPFIVPQVTVPPGESLWLPLAVSIGPDGLCHECSNFSGVEHVVYATAELLSIEFENGILAMEFDAPVAGEAVLQLARQPVGPYLAAGNPHDFDWDDKTLRARLPVPANPAPGHHVRVGIAIEEPETSAFFNEAKRLVIGQVNTVSTTYSSPEVANRSRLRLPDGFKAVPKVKSPNEIDYEVTVPAESLHGDWANLAIEADGFLLGRARLQLFRPVSIRLTDPLAIHFGSETELTPEPPIAAADPKAGADMEITIRNNSTGIQTYRIQPSGDGLDFFPPKSEISVGAVDERKLSLHVFAAEGITGLHDWRLHVTSPSSPSYTEDLPMRLLLLPRGRTAVWSADLDGDGSPEWVLETQKVRAVFSSQDGGRWIEFTAKDSNVNFLPEQGALAGAGQVDARVTEDGVEFTSPGSMRTVRLSDNTLTIEQRAPLPSGGPTPGKRGNATLTVERPSPNRGIYAIK